MRVFCSDYRTTVRAADRRNKGRYLGQCLQGCSQAALVASSLVLVDDFLVGDTVDRRNGSLEYLRRCCLVASADRLADGFDCRAQRGTLAGIVCVLLDCLTSTFARLCGICHEYFLNRNRTAFAGCETEFCKAADYNVFLRNGQLEDWSGDNFPAFSRQLGDFHPQDVITLLEHQLKQAVVQHASKQRSRLSGRPAPNSYNCAP